MSQESKTPRTDVHAEEVFNWEDELVCVVTADFARQLERELADANSRLAFMIDAQAQVAEYSMGWNCEWHCDYNDKHETGCYPAAIEAIDAAIKARDELRALHE